MKAFLLVLAVASTAAAYELDDLELTRDLDSAADPRLFFTNFTSSLIQVNATILAYGLLFLAIVGAAAVALYYLYLESQSSSGYGYGSHGSYNSHYSQYARSNNDAATEFNLLNAIYMMQELYEKFDYNDIDCQKKLICEVLREPEFFGAAAQKAKTGFQWGETLANMITLPDDVSQLVDEYMDASRTSDAPRECAEYFTCPFSIKEVLQKHLANHL